MLERYRKISKSVLFLVVAELLIHLVNSSFILILNLYLRKIGYEDARIAQLNSYRFLGTLFFAFPLGIFIKGKPLRPFFLASSLLVPSVSLMLLYSVQNHIEVLIIPGFILWGSSFMILSVCSLPFIMRSEKDDVVTEAISLNFSTWSLATIIAGTLITLMSAIGSLDIGWLKLQFDEYHMLVVISCLGYLSPFFMLRIKEAKPRSDSRKFATNLRALHLDYDWFLIGRVLIPNMLIAVGAGLTIPFVNLFFNSVFHLEAEAFSMIGAAASVIVFVSMLVIPVIRRRYGFTKAIMLPQSLAIFFLVVLAVTQLIDYMSWAVYVAIGAFLLRQPLMNMAGPVTSELGMKYVGERNQELISALSSSIWSASWFISARIFQVLRQLDLDYYQIFFITALLYSVGVLFYYLLIRDFKAHHPDHNLDGDGPKKVKITKVREESIQRWK